MRIRKAVIPAAGLGTRFLPATLSVPKEMLPLVDKPIILFNAEELVAAGIEELILITSGAKTAVEQLFGAPNEVESALEKLGKTELIKPVLAMRQKLKIKLVPQDAPLGLGHAVLCAAEAVGKDPFAVLLGDEIMLSRPGAESATQQLAQLYREHETSIVAVMEVPREDVRKYGIIRTREKDGEAPGIWHVEEVVEKPEIEKAPSRLALPGRYVFDAAIFEHLRQVRPGRGGEIQLTDGMTLLAKHQGLLATVLNADRFDAGDKLGFVLANIEVGLRHPDIGTALKKELVTRFGGQS
jgi:UTP--glucose-1-phosphate uridylyltransferase